MKAVLLSTLEMLMNRYVQADIKSVKALLPYQNKLINIEITDFNLSLYIKVTDYGFLITDESDDPISTKISGTMLNFINLGLNKASNSAFYSSDLTISGDLMLGEQIRAILTAVDMDWQAELAEYMPDAIAHYLVKGVKRTAETLQYVGKSVRSTVSDYVMHEARYLPLSIEVKQWYQEVATVRNDVDRLEMRLERYVRLRG